jgi:hypothetical protein
MYIASRNLEGCQIWADTFTISLLRSHLDRNKSRQLRADT